MVIICNINRIILLISTFQSTNISVVSCPLLGDNCFSACIQLQDLLLTLVEFLKRIRQPMTTRNVNIPSMINSPDYYMSWNIGFLCAQRASQASKYQHCP